jgi:hypothetical protein
MIHLDAELDTSVAFMTSSDVFLARFNSFMIRNKPKGDRFKLK